MGKMHGLAGGLNKDLPKFPLWSITALIAGAIFTLLPSFAPQVASANDQFVHHRTIQTSFRAPKKVPLPTANPKRWKKPLQKLQANQTRSSKSVSPSGQKQQKQDPVAALIQTPQSAPLPPLPDRNPLRQLKANVGEVRHSFTSVLIPPLPTRGSKITNTVKALAPLLHYDISANDIKLLQKSIDHILQNQMAEARSTRRAISDPTARKLAYWYYLRMAGDIPDPMDMERFRQKNKDWPNRSLLLRRTERALLKKDVAPGKVKKFYSRQKPTSGIGKYLLARAFKQTGHGAQALKLARSAWHTHALGKKIEKEFLAEFGEHLKAPDHRRRADHFLYKDKRRHLPTVRRVKKKLSKKEEEKINLRMEVIKRRLAAAEKEYKALGSKAHKDAGLLFNKIQLLRHKDKYDLSRALLRKAPIDSKSLVEPDEWWIERRLQTRYALRHNKPRAAYEIASRHGKISRKNLAEAEFLSGWIALTRLNKIQRAAKHFAAQRRAVRSRPEIAKAEYWLGRVKMAQKDSIGALSHYSASAKYYRTYYGQLALQEIEQAANILKVKTPAPRANDLRKFLARDAVRALIISHRAQLTSLTPKFFNTLAWRLKNPGEMTLLAELATQIHSIRGAVITGKIGVYRGFKLDRYAYPINALPHFDRLTPKIDDALVLALARQESEFNAKAKSPVGARGMMQIMPGTARAIARQHKVRYSRTRLVSDPSYNISLGVAHLHDLINIYNGSYILPLVAYNAGPGRVKQWIEAFGDPRSPDVDTIDWIESIPFSETRRYVQRIMSSAQIFRHRLQGGKGRIQLLKDINRGHLEHTRGKNMERTQKTTEPVSIIAAR